MRIRAWPLCLLTLALGLMPAACKTTTHQTGEDDSARHKESRGPAAGARPTDGLSLVAGDYSEMNVSVPMRDGTVLKADVYRPTQAGKYPVLIYRTPYEKGEETAYNRQTFQNVVRRGYVLIVQDVRGMYASQGTFTPYVNEGKDGYDTIQWAAAQTWSNGKVGMFGVSYPCAVQWLAAVENPPNLTAIAPAMCFSNMDQFIHYQGVFDISWQWWIWHYAMPQARVRGNLEGPKTYAEAAAEWNRIGEAAFAGWRPLLDLPYMRDAAPYYYDWISAGPYNPSWAWGDMRTRYSNVKAAVLNVSGWYDEPYGSNGAVTNYTGLLTSRAGQAPKTRLVIGPWTHGAYEMDMTKSGTRSFSAAAKIGYDKTILDWFDYHMKGLPNGVDKLSPVSVFVMGRDTWTNAPAWPLAGTTPTPLYLTRTTAGAGQASFTAPTGGAAKSTFVSDPQNPVKDPNDTTYGAFDLRSLSTRADVLTFDTPALTADLEVTGNIKAEIYLSADQKDTDLFVRVLQVDSKGVALNLMGPALEVQRVSYRSKTQQRQLLTPGQVVKVTLDTPLTGNLFKKGMKIRVLISATSTPTYFPPNLHTGELEATSQASVKATIDVHHAGQYQSRLILPVVN